MQAFRVLLIIFLLAIGSYTGYVIFTYGLNIAPIFFGEITQLTWPGQFNLDFLIYLNISALWIGWRHRWSLASWGLIIAALILGATFLMPYLLWATFQARGDVKQLLMGHQL